jgi:hypothetical protein
VLGARALDEEDRGLIVRAGKLLQSLEGHKQARALAVLNDARNVEVVVQ